MIFTNTIIDKFFSIPIVTLVTLQKVHNKNQNVTVYCFIKNGVSCNFLVPSLSRNDAS